MRLAKRAAWLALSAAVVAGCAEPPPPTDVKVDLTSGTPAGVDRFVQEAKGKVVLVDFWATWCGPCVKKFPALVKLHDEYGPKGLVVLGVSFDEPEQADKVQTFLARRRATFPNVIVPTRSQDELRLLAGRFGYDGGIPHVALFDKAGKRVWDSQADGFGEFELEQRITTELAKGAPQP